jgi:excisionase family DNA binding protein
MEPLALTVEQTAQLLQLCTRTIRTMFAAGELRGNRRGNQIRITRASVEAWLGGAPAGKGRGPRV